MEELGISKGYRGIQGNVAKLVSSAHDHMRNHTNPLIKEVALYNASPLYRISSEELSFSS